LNSERYFFVRVLAKKNEFYASSGDLVDVEYVLMVSSVRAYAVRVMGLVSVTAMPRGLQAGLCHAFPSDSASNLSTSTNPWSSQWTTEYQL